MAQYRYLFTNLLTGTVTVELPLYGVSFSRRLNRAGNCTFSFPLDSEGFVNQTVVESTTPGSTGFYIERNGSLVWGGVVWSRTYQSQAKSLSFTGQTFESFLYKQFIEETLTYTATDQRNILIALINYMQGKTNADVGIAVPSSFTSNITRTVTFPDYEVWSIGKAIESLVSYSNGFDYTLDVRYDSNGDPEIFLATDDVLGQDIESTGMILEYPGNIRNYWYPENAAEAATSVLGVGAGEGSAMLRSKATNTDMLGYGYPDIQSVYTNKDVQLQATLDSQTLQRGTLLTPPISIPTIELNPDFEPTFGSFQLGDYSNLYIRDPRFPSGLEQSVRVVGFSARPTESDQQEELKLVLAGQEDAA
jgi:hypothetical protein